MERNEFLEILNKNFSKSQGRDIHHSEKQGYNEEYDSGEDFVRKMIVKHLKQNGFEVKSVRKKTEKGPDIMVKTSPPKIIEVKGFPSIKRTKGSRTGTTKPKSQIRGQARGWIWEGISQLIEHKSKNSEIEIGLGLPNKKFYQDYLKKIKWFLKLISLEIFLVDGEKVSIYSNK